MAFVVAAAFWLAVATPAQAFFPGIPIDPVTGMPISPPAPSLPADGSAPPPAPGAPPFNPFPVVPPERTPVLPAPPPPVALPAPAIRVGLSWMKTNAQAAGTNAGLQVLNPAGKQIYTSAKGEVLGFAVDPKGGGIVLQGGTGLPVSVQPGPLRLKAVVPSGSTEPALIRFSGTRYRGDLELRLVTSGTRLAVINVVEVEAYLQGVVPKEMSPSWPAEALKAQAVAARTYALAEQRSRKYGTLGFDVSDDDASQVYGGFDAEHAATGTAVQATRGQVVTYQGKLATTYFFASSGGHTENNEVIWNSGVAVPYLRGVPDPDRDSPWFSWQAIKSGDAIARLFRTANRPLDLGEVMAVRGEGNKGASGRWSQWRIIGSKAETVLTAEDARWRFDLRSAPKEVRVTKIQPGIPARTLGTDRTVSVLGAFGVQVTEASDALRVGIGGGTNGGSGVSFGIGSGRFAPALGSMAVGAVGEIAAEFEIAGGGWGHGVGMSQYGARAMAAQGRTYQEILRQYYQGTQVVAWSGL